MTDALAGARDESGEVVAIEDLGGGILELTAHLPHLAKTAAAGQFAQLRCGDSPLLRRPFSVAWTHADTCSFVFAAVGEGTGKLARLRAGQRFDALGPLGSGFSLPRDGGIAVCVSGGLGCAPFPLLVRALGRAGVQRVLVLSGAATAGRLYPAERFGRGDRGVDVLEATDDGTAGHSGRVTELLTDALAGAPVALYACGPNPMLGAVAEVLSIHRRSAGIREASLEAPMGCGFGTCLGCALPVRGPSERGAWALCCREGPVMSIDRVDWEGIRALPPPNVA